MTKTAWIIFSAADAPKDLPKWKIIMKVAELDTREEVLSDGSIKSTFTGPAEQIDAIVETLANSRRGRFVQRGGGEA
jgi:hypothetical protein